MSATAVSELVVRGVHRRYGHTRALDGLDLTARAGEVLGIAGPNGAGKSTLVRILAGEEVASEGEVLLDGEALDAARAAERVAVVHQEPELFPNLTVADNLMVGREGGGGTRPGPGELERALMDELDLTPVAGRLLGDCTLATQQRTEIARALARDTRVFLFDEPNSALTEAESEELFAEMRRLADAGRVVFLVTHRLGDLVDVCSRVAIVRDGRVRAVLEGEDITEEAIAHQLVVGDDRTAGAGGDGDGDAEDDRVERGDRGDELVRLRGWASPAGAFAATDLDLHAREIVALMGVEGSGARELLRSIGAIEPADGDLRVGDLQGRTAMLRATAYVPATRQLSLFSNLDVGQNVVVRLDEEIAGRGGALSRARMHALAREQVARFHVKTRTIFQGIRSLSGGNQQKVAIAAALARRPQALLLEEPTRGVDIASRREIYRLLRGFALTGNTVLMFCTEVGEVFDAADRVHVVAGGGLSEPVAVADYERIELLAARVAELEGAARAAAA